MIQLFEDVEDEFEYVVSCFEKKCSINMIMFDESFNPTDFNNIMSLFLPDVLCNIVCDYYRPYLAFVISGHVEFHAPIDYRICVSDIHTNEHLLITILVRFTKSKIETIDFKIVNSQPKIVDSLLPWLNNLHPKKIDKC